MKSEKSQCKIKNYLKLKGANMGIDLASNSKNIH